MRVTCPNCGKAGYLVMEEGDRKWDEKLLTATVKYRIFVKHGTEGCELGPDLS